MAAPLHFKPGWGPNAGCGECPSEGDDCADVVPSGRSLRTQAGGRMPWFPRPPSVQNGSEASKLELLAGVGQAQNAGGQRALFCVACRLHGPRGACRGQDPWTKQVSGCRALAAMECLAFPLRQACLSCYLSGSRTR